MDSPPYLIGLAICVFIFCVTYFSVRSTDTQLKLRAELTRERECSQKWEEVANDYKNAATDAENSVKKLERSVEDWKMIANDPLNAERVLKVNQE